MVIFSFGRHRIYPTPLRGGQEKEKREWRLSPGESGSPSQPTAGTSGFDPERLARLAECAKNTGVVDPADLPDDVD